jgi:hypothetical protein
VSKSKTFREFPIPYDDPLADAHAAVSAWVEEAVGSLPARESYRDVDMKGLPSGKTLLAGKPEQSRRYVLAAVAQARHWDALGEQVRAGAKTEIERVNAHRLPDWDQVWGRRRQATAVAAALLRRSLPLHKEDLIAILQWCTALAANWAYAFPTGPITKALERYAAGSPVDDELRAAMGRFAAWLRASHDKDARRLGTQVELLCAAEGTEPAALDAPPPPPPASRPAPTPAPAGSATVLVRLKQLAGTLPDEAQPPATFIGPDRFSLSTDSPLAQEHEWLTTLLQEIVGSNEYFKPNLMHFPAGRMLLNRDARTLGCVILAAAERQVHSLTGGPGPGFGGGDGGSWQARYATAGLVPPLLLAPFEFDRAGLFDLLLYLASRPAHARDETAATSRQLLAQVEAEAEQSPLTEGERYVLALYRASLLTGPALGAPSEPVARLTRLIDDGANFFLVPGEAWSDAVNADLGRLAPASAAAWTTLLTHALSATSARPSGKWLTAGGKLVQAVGDEAVEEALLRWLPLVAQGQTIRKLAQYSGDTRGSGDVIHEENATALRGLLWLVNELPRPDALVRAIAAVALSAYKKVPGIGPRAVKVGNAAVYALSEIGSTEAVGQLAMLKLRIKFGTAQKEIEKAFNAAAEALGLPRDQIEEMGVPSYGLEEVGLRRESLGEYRAELRVSGSDARLTWFDPKGKALKSVPAKVKSEHNDELRELQQALKDIQAMLPAQRDRLDGLFLRRKTWPWAEWCERYRDHPLIGTIARRLIWRVDGTPALFLDGVPTDVDGAALAPGPAAQVALWHPVGCSIDEVLAWRRRLEAAGVTQPFKQAHREVYLLTDAERNTHSYSNRFAAHILRQHQFNALCAARGWKSRLRLMVDDAYPPATRELPEWGLRAEFWIEGIGDNYGTDSNEAGVYLRLATDQVRFYPTAAATNWAHAGGGGYTTSAGGPGPGQVNEPLPLEEVPTLVFSEVMRDVDLFVGVASVGNDPTWQDGGPEGRYREYWQDYAFGALSGTANTRKQVLERLVPRLKIADRCSFADRFLVVRGRKRTYKIHLGSGNILMEPNDEYLCIVPDSRARAGQDDLFLPFEGDATLSIILSKALLLADDTKIKDPTITRQIDRR